MNALIKVDTSQDRPTVLARNLHEFLEIGTQFSIWFDRMKTYGFEEHTDFEAINQKRLTAQGNETTYTDYQLTIDTAKELCMIQRTERGKQARQYFLEIEKRWNDPSMVMARALRMADEKVKQLESKVEADKPKVLFAEAVEDSGDLILVKEMAVIISQRGFKIGQNQLFEYLRDNGYLCKKYGDMYNLPTKRYQHLFKVTKRIIQNSKDSRVRNTPKINGQGQVYFIKKFDGYLGQGLTVKELLIKKEVI